MSLFDLPITHNHISAPSPEHLTRAPAYKEPYVRVSFPDGTVDAKAKAWSSDAVLVRWAEAGDVPHTAWVPASWCNRISRDESAWQDGYDYLD